MNRLSLSVAVAALSLALPALAVPAAAQTKEITIGITITTTGTIMRPTGTPTAMGIRADTIIMRRPTWAQRSRSAWR